MKPTKPLLISFVIVTIVAVLSGVFVVWNSSQRGLDFSAAKEGTSKAERKDAVKTSSNPGSQDEVKLRPLPVSRKSEAHEWAVGDATSPAIIEKIAHNPE